MMERTITYINCSIKKAIITHTHTHTHKHTHTHTHTHTNTHTHTHTHRMGFARSQQKDWNCV